MKKDCLHIPVYTRVFVFIFIIYITKDIYENIKERKGRKKNQYLQKYPN